MMITGLMNMLMVLMELLIMGTVAILLMGMQFMRLS